MARPIILFPFLGEGVGGSHIATFELARALKQDSDIDARILCVAHSPIAAEAQRYGLMTSPTGEPSARRHSPVYDLHRMPPRLGRLQSYGPRAIVHCNDLGALQSWGPPAKLLGLRVVYHHHSLNRPVLPNRMVLAVADAVVCVSDVCRNNLFFVQSRKLTVALNPFTLTQPDRLAERRRVLDAIGATNDARLFAFVGNLWRRKRPLFFLRVCQHILALDKRARFLVFGRAGDFQLDDMYEHAQDLGLGERLHLMGFRAPAEANLAAIDVLLAPAIREPFGRTLVEAILLGVPYVATDDAGHSEIHARWAGGAALDADASAGQFAQAAVGVADEPEKYVLPVDRRGEIADQVSASQHAAQILGVYDRLGRAAAIVGRATG